MMKRAESGVRLPDPALTTTHLVEARHVMAAHQIIGPDDKILDDAGRDWSWAFVAFRDVPGWPGYVASTQGHVFSCRTNGGKLGDRWHFRCPTLSRDGYLQLGVHQNRRSLFTGVHSLVLSAFEGRCPPGLQVRHGNGNRTDNRIDNLRWGTPRENIGDREAHGNTARGERNGRAKLRRADAEELRRLRGQGWTFMRLARWFGISKRQAGRIINHETWKHAELTKGDREGRPCRD
jgi:hypothetical protein